ncbi:uncharacterized protein isoform X2 [Musca autumnalis]|uniref:uncharacterized protein isoform X2 n=1 Tax=Musca autumnalis TaxID=221902 RepID=UPI003CEE09C1
MPVVDVANMKVADLKRELKDRGLSVAGNKNELQDRLQAALDGGELLEDSSIVGEDILDEEAVLSDEEKILAGDENELLKSPTTTPTTVIPTKGASDANDSVLAEDEILESPTSTAKKVVLKRKISVNSSSTSESVNTTKENTEPTQAKTAKVSEHTPITIGTIGNSSSTSVAPSTGAAKKFSEMTLQERLDLRAKKFGINSAAEAAASFVHSPIPGVNCEKQVELLKKRAERFGCVTSANLAILNAEERRLKRLQRFGGEAAVKDATKTNTTATDSSEWAEKARKRLERFGGGSTTTPTTTSTATAAATTKTTATNPVATAASN